MFKPPSNTPEQPLPRKREAGAILTRLLPKLAAMGALLLIGGLPGAAHAQFRTSGKALMQLMLSQPSIDMFSPVIPNASFDPPVVRPGEKSIYRVTFNALEASIRWPGEVAAPPQLQLKARAQGQFLQPFAGEFRPQTGFNYEVRATQTGRFTIPGFTVEVYGRSVVVPAAELQVVNDAPEDHEPAKEIVLETSSTNLFLGETFDVRVVSISSTPNTVQGINQVQFDGDGFLVNKSAARQSIAPVDSNGHRTLEYIYESSMIPIAAGQLKLSAQGFTSVRGFNHPIIVNGRAIVSGEPPQYVLLDSDPVRIHVRPLPSEGRLPGFTGAIGTFRSDPPQLARETVNVGDPVELSVVVRGDGDLSRLVPPPAPVVKGWQVFDAVTKGFVAGPATAGPGVLFSYTLIPTTDEVHTTPAIPFSYFDPERATYVDLTFPPTTIHIVARGMPTNFAALPEFTDSGPVQEKMPTLSGLAQTQGRKEASLVPLQLRGWFLVVQLIPASAFLGLWLWDRRRRYLAQHPEIVRRRKARRELRRQRRLMNRAGSVADAPDFTRCAVTALRVASAPHYPANPQAMVCGDVLGLLDESERQGQPGEIVRRVFAAADDSRFAPMPHSHAELLALKTGLEELLVKLEERL